MEDDLEPANMIEKEWTEGSINNPAYLMLEKYD